MQEEIRKVRKQHISKNGCFIFGNDRDGKGIRNICSVSSKARSEVIYDKASELQDVSVLSNI